MPVPPSIPALIELLVQAADEARAGRGTSLDALDASLRSPRHPRGSEWLPLVGLGVCAGITWWNARMPAFGAPGAAAGLPWWSWLGVLIAMLACLAWAGRDLSRRESQRAGHVLHDRILRTGLALLRAGAHPEQVREELSAFLPPSARPATSARAA